MEVHCYYCDKAEDLDTCRRCLKPICPNHRWGTGSLSDGYYCLSSTNECGDESDEDESPMAKIMGVSMKPKRKRSLLERLPRLGPGGQIAVMFGTAIGIVLILELIQRLIVR
jgi:hypothetical protein